VNESPKPTSEEKTIAAACHLLSIPFPYMAPLVTFFWKRKQSRFVALHASQAFFEALILSIVLFIALAISMAFTIAKVWQAIETRGQSLTWDDLWAALIKAGATWIILAVVSFYYTLSSVIQAIQALQGRWSGSMISGRLAKRVAPQEEGPHPIG
jgi:hypothetical protein